MKIIIDEDPCVTRGKSEALSSMHSPQIHKIIHEHLKIRKITSSWMPHYLTNKNWEDRVSICQKNLVELSRKFSRKMALCYVINGDESWFSYRNIAHKQSKKTCIGDGEKTK